MFSKFKIQKKRLLSVKKLYIQKKKHIETEQGWHKITTLKELEHRKLG